MHSTTSSALCTSQRSGPSRCRVTCSPSSHLGGGQGNGRGCTAQQRRPGVDSAACTRILFQSALHAATYLANSMEKGILPARTSGRGRLPAPPDLRAMTPPRMLPHPARFLHLSRFQNITTEVGSALDCSSVGLGGLRAVGILCWCRGQPPPAWAGLPARPAPGA